MDTTKYSVTRISTTTLERIRELAEKHEVSVPKMIDLIVQDYETIKSVVKIWDEIRKQETPNKEDDNDIFPM